MVVVAEDRIDGPHLLVVTVGVAAGSDLNVLEAVVDVTPVPADCEPFDHPDQQQSYPSLPDCAYHVSSPPRQHSISMRSF